MFYLYTLYVPVSTPLTPNPGPAACPQPAYSLYSTDSEDQVMKLIYSRLMMRMNQRGTQRSDTVLQGSLISKKA